MKKEFIKWEKAYNGIIKKYSKIDIKKARKYFISRGFHYTPHMLKEYLEKVNIKRR